VKSEDAEAQTISSKRFPKQFILILRQFNGMTLIASDIHKVSLFLKFWLNSVYTIRPILYITEQIPNCLRHSFFKNMQYQT